MNRQERLGEYIIKNLAFVTLLCILVGMIFVNALIPKIGVLKERQAEYRRISAIHQQIVSANREITAQIQQKKEEKILSFLEKNVNPLYIQEIAKDFFENISVQKSSQELPQKSQFVTTGYTLKAKTTQIKDIFEFVARLEKLIPNATLVLPFKVEKEDLFKNILNIELTINLTQTREFFESQLSNNISQAPQKDAKSIESQEKIDSKHRITDIHKKP